MKTGASGRVGWWRWPLILLCLPLAWAAVRNAAQAVYAGDNPAYATRFWPAGGAALGNLALDRVVAAGGTVDATSAELARRALGAGPRAATPLVVAGLGASAAGDLGKAQALMEAARARQPRTDVARFWLLDHYMRIGDYAAGLDEIQPAIALRTGTGPGLMALVGGLAATPAAHRALIAKLEKQPRWRTQFFQQEASAPLPPRTILALLEAIPPARDPDAAMAEQHAVIDVLVARGNYAEAYGVWQSFLPPSDRPAIGAIYDPDFRGLPGSAPFNWSLIGQADVSVARASLADDSAESGLSIDYRATVPRTIASEIIPVAAGSYVLAVEARGTGDPDSAARISATVTCLGDNRTLASLPLSPLPATPRRFQTELVVPPTCAFATIALSGQPGDAFEAVSAQIAAIRLTRRS